MNIGIKREILWCSVLSFAVILLSIFLSETGLINLFGDFKTAQKVDFIFIMLGSVAFLLNAIWIASAINKKEQVLVIIVGLMIGYFLYPFVNYSGKESFAKFGWFSSFQYGIFIASLPAFFWRFHLAKKQPYDFINILLALYFLTFLLSIHPAGMLQLSSVMNPYAYDTYMLSYDYALFNGFSPSRAIGVWAYAFSWFEATLTWTYILIPFGLTSLIGLYMYNPKGAKFHVIALFLIASLSATIAYHFLPVLGPKFVWGDYFYALMPEANLLEIGKTIIKNQSPKNAVPSMHFGWSFMFWLVALYSGSKGWRAFFAIFMGLTVLATLGLGQHYAVDLMISFPFCLAFISIFARKITWNKKRYLSIFGNLLIWLLWVIFIRFGEFFLQEQPWLVWLWTILALGATWYFYRPIHYKIMQSEIDEKDLFPKESMIVCLKQLIPKNKKIMLVGLMFSLSGFVGLMYQVLFSKELALTFGSAAVATYTVLATYMGGMALGAWIGGWVAEKSNKPLRDYAFCEIFIGLYCLATPWIFSLIRNFYVYIGSGLPADSTSLLILRFCFGVLALMIPTALMGATLPLLAKYIHNKLNGLGQTVAMLYATNVLGAAFGALVAGYAILPIFGIKGTTNIAAMGNFLIAWMAIKIGLNIIVETTKTSLPPIIKAPDHRLKLAGLASLFVGGMVTLALETKYIHLLAIVAGNSTYAFSLMLFTFLIGLGLGAEIARRLLKLNLSLGTLLGWLQAGLATTILLGVFMWDSLSGLFLGYTFFPVLNTFGAREVVRASVCFFAMLPPAIFIGAAYPVAIECVTQAYSKKIHALGLAAALNTMGNIIGVLVGGFVILPLLGGLRGVQLLALITGLLAFFIWLITPKNIKSCLSYCLFFLLLLFFQPTTFDYTTIASGANVYFSGQTYGEVIDRSESVDGGLTTVNLNFVNGKYIKTLMTNGKFQGSDSMGGEMKAQVGFALSPLLHTAARDEALVIGYGTGASARVFHDAGMKHIDVAEISSDIIRVANKHFSNINDKVSEKPNVKIHLTDGRNYLLLNQKKYDVISMEITSIWFAGAASLYNKEFYALAKKSLKPSGVLQQWVQLHHMSMADISFILGSVSSEFSYVWIYVIGGQGMIIASNDISNQPTLENAKLLDNTVALKPLLKLYEGGSVELMKQVVAFPDGVKSLVEDFGLPLNKAVSTDDNLYLEYSTPKGNVLPTGVFAENLRWISSYLPENSELKKEFRARRDKIESPEKLPMVKERVFGALPDTKISPIEPKH